MKGDDDGSRIDCLTTKAGKDAEGKGRVDRIPAR